MRKAKMPAAAFLAGLTAVLGVMGSTGTALAADSGIGNAAGSSATATPKIPPPHWYEYRAVNKRFQGYHTGHWVICAHAVNRSSKTAHATCNRTVTTSTSYSLSGGYDPSEVSHSVGFDITVSYQYSTQYGLTVDLRPRTQAYIAFGMDYNQWRYGMEKRYCVAYYCLPWSSPSYVRVQRALDPAIGAFDKRPA